MANSQLVIKGAQTTYKATKKILKNGLKKNKVKMGSSIKLAKNIGIYNKRGWAAHHVIPIEVYSSHRVFKKLKDFDIDQASNGIALPTKKGISISKLPLHRGSHPSYSQAVSRALDKIPENTSDEVTKSMVRATMQKFKRKLKEGKPLHEKYGAKW